MDAHRAFYRMPLGYGPMPGPRQSAEGSPLAGWDQADVKTCTVVFRAPAKQLADFLPHQCFLLDPLSSNPEGLATASISFTELKNLPWLAGRGYNLCGLYIHDVVCRGAEETVRGKYLSVLFENRADPIISGREELGYAKVFASLDEEEGESSVIVRMGWEGAIFGEMQLESLEPASNSQEESPTNPTGSNGILHYKYIPRTGSPGQADVEYPTYSPSPEKPVSVVQSIRVSPRANISFKALGFSELPTLHHIAAKLASIDIQDIVDARITIAKGTTSLREQRAIRM